MKAYRVTTAELWTHTDDQGRETHINIDTLKQAIADYGLDTQYVELPTETLDQIVERHGVEIRRLETMTAKDLRTPIIVIQWETGSHSIADGGHRRAWRVWRNAAPQPHTLEAYIVPAEVWRTCQVADFSDKIRGSADLLPQRAGTA